jgi:hypothetical protein
MSLSPIDSCPLHNAMCSADRLSCKQQNTISLEINKFITLLTFNLRESIITAVMHRADYSSSTDQVNPVH